MLFCAIHNLLLGDLIFFFFKDVRFVHKSRGAYVGAVEETRMCVVYVSVKNGTQW